MKVILIGNGPSCLKHRAGRLIDTYDVVVRLNNFQIVGFEEYVGTKTDVVISNGNTDVHYKPEHHDKTTIILENHDIDENEHIANHNLCPMKSIFVLFKKDFLMRPYGIEKPSTGLFALFYLTLMYKDLTCYGFDSFTEDGHYFNPEWKSWHRHTSDEKRIIDDLVRTGKVKRLLT
jgi:hypothetical protein